MTAFTAVQTVFASPRWFELATSGTQSTTTATCLVTTQDVALDGLVLVFNVTALTGTSPTVTFLVQGYDPVGAELYTLGTSTGLTTTAINSAGTAVLRINPAIPNSSTVAQDMVPPQFVVTSTIGGTGSPTATFTASGILDL